MSAAGGPVRSMTGYGRGSSALGQGTLTAEIRTVNSRFLDVRIRVPRDLTPQESALRKRLGRSFKRGQVDLSVRIKGGAGSAGAVEIDQAALQSYVEAASSARERSGISGDPSIEVLLGLPGVACVRESELELEPAVG